MKWFIGADGEPRFFAPLVRRVPTDPPPVPDEPMPWPLRRIICNSGVVRFVRRRR
ncbi:hypothetical protein ACI2K4_10270 [Micromonospora sp. NPDC050397]|uniref:hypothetical protein n=1 Tax=Micromonospora sp. NPDC050397 TaxID=3364279 RepID=UPI00384F3C37